MTDLGDGPAADLAALFGLLVVGEGQPTLAVLNSWFHEIPPPDTQLDTATPHPADIGDHDENLDLDGRQEPSSGMARR